MNGSVVGSGARRAAAVLGAAALLAAPAYAGKLALRPGMGGVPDIGAIQCNTFTAMHREGTSGTRQAILYWAEGFVYARTGKSMDDYLAGRPGGDAWTFETLTGFVVEFCEAHPEAPVPAAVEDLWSRLQPENDSAR